MITLLLRGQVRAGKNNMKVTRLGRHYPAKLFAKWAEEAIQQITWQLRKYPDFEIINRPVRITVAYTPADKRIRDSTAILDGLYHVLEKAQVIRNDYFFQQVAYAQFAEDKDNPRVSITIEETYPYSYQRREHP